MSPDNEINTHRKVALLEYVQKHIHEKDINIHLNNITELMEKFTPSKEEVQSLMHYLTQEGNALDSKKFIHNLIENTPRYREDLMTIAEYLKQEGRQEGGSKREKEIARNLLSIGLDRAAIVRATGVSSSDLDILAGQSAKNND